MTPRDDYEEVERWLNNAEALASAAEDADTVFEIMALKERLGMDTSRPGGGQN